MSAIRAFSARTAAAAGVLGLALTIVAAASRAPVAEVDVVLTDYNIQMNNVLQAGPTTFNVRNEGEVEHGFAVRTSGAQPKNLALLKSNLAPGASAKLEANLTPGSYEVLDPLKDHKDRGMLLRVKVQDKTIP